MSKKNIWLLLILALLLAGVGVYQWWWAPRQIEQKQPVNFLAAVDWSQIDRLTIKRDGQTIELGRDQGKWLVASQNNVPAKEMLVEAVKTAWQQAANQPLNIASLDADGQKALQADGRLSVNLKSGSADLGAWNIGLSRSGVTYISRVGDDKTYEAAGDLHSVFDYADWQEKATSTTGENR